jgi:3-mercaptopyruvate sulfurtransferase SseA
MQLARMGVTRVRPLRGGFDGWKVAGYPLVEYIDAPSTELPLTTKPSVKVIHV